MILSVVQFRINSFIKIKLIEIIIPISINFYFELHDFQYKIKKIRYPSIFFILKGNLLQY